MRIKRAAINVLIIVTVLISVMFTFIHIRCLKEEYIVKKNYDAISDKVHNIKKNSEYSVDFNELKQINPDIVAWISIPDTPVDYPVVMAKDNNDYYLRHDVKGNYSQYGSIFTDFRLYGSPLKQKNCIIYGHNMGRWTDVMFSSLMEYREQEYYDKHKSINIYTEKEGKIKYKIVSVIEVNTFSYIYNLSFQSKEEFEDWLKKSVLESMIECDIENMSNVDRVVTLSTCTYGENKMVLVCVPIKQ